MIKFVKVVKDNMDVALNIQKEIFPQESAAYEYNNILNRNSEYQQNFIVYIGDIIIGITGLYSNEPIEETNSLWLCWFGVLKAYRNHGLGKQILLNTINISKELSKKHPIKYLRLYTSFDENPVSIYLYDSIMDVKELYTNPLDNNYNNTCVIYTKSLTNEQPKLWNNKFLNIKKMNGNEKI